MEESVQDGSGGAKDRDLRLEYMYAKSTVLSVPTTTVSVTRRKQMEMQDCFREREVEEAGRQALLFVREYPKVDLLTNSLFSSSIDAYFLK